MSQQVGSDAAVEAPAGREPRSLIALQCELRALFASRPANRAMAEVLGRIGAYLHADYMVLHARLGVHLLSEEWSAPGVLFEEEQRDQVNTVLWEAISAEQTRLTRLDGAPGSPAVATSVMYDEDVEPSGGAAVVLRIEDGGRAQQVLTQLEGVLGYLSLLLGSETGKTAQVAERREIEPSVAADHPTRLAYAMAAEIVNRHGFELASVGFARGSGIEVVAVSGVDEIRPANPGVQLVRAAMEECMDRAEAIVYSDRGEGGDEDDCRLHAQWSASLRGDCVASFPLVLIDEVVAVISVSRSGNTPLTRQQVLVVAEEMAGYAALIPLSRAAARGLGAHALASGRSLLRRIAGHGRRRALLVGALLLAAVSWLALGQLHHTFTVPCVVEPANRRTVSCPREGILAELFVRPGDHVREGQLLAVLDANDDLLRREELLADIGSLDARIDKALADRDTGQVRIHEAQKRNVLAQLAVVDASIEQAQIRSPQGGVILDGDLREQLGGRLTMGQELFQLARYDRASVRLQVPENLVLAAHACESAEFATSARPDRRFELEGLRIAPASSVVEDRNVFLGDATVSVNLDEVAPGMEGVAHLDAGLRSAWWVLTHRFTNWLRLNFWI